MKKLLSFVALCVVLAILPGISSCDRSLIQGVGFKVEPNLETIKVQLNFADDVESDLGGTFDVKTYGTLEVEPSTPDSPFNVGFRLNMHIFYDSDFTDPVKFQPVTTLPSGQPIPVAVNRAMIQVKLENPVNPNFDVYGYVDIAGREWLGVAITLKFLNNKYFPAGLSLSKNFLKDSNRRPRAVGAVFGPKVDENGQLKVPGGIAVFANVRALIEGARNGGKFDGREGGGNAPYLFEGTMASYYQSRPREALQLADAFKTLLRENSHGRRFGD